MFEAEGPASRSSLPG